jgi:hypothetical protein
MTIIEWSQRISLNPQCGAKSLDGAKGFTLTR